MLHRMRQPEYSNVRVDWGGAPVWTSGPATSVFGGDTVAAFAGFSRAAQVGAIRLLADDAQGKTLELARGETDAPCSGDSLPRIAAAYRMAQNPDADNLALAVQYQLMSKQTHCVLVHERAAADQATQQAVVHRVSSMLAAGRGGVGKVMAMATSFSLDTLDLEARSMPAATGMMGVSAADAGVQANLEFDPPAFLRRAGGVQAHTKVEDLIRAVASHFATGGQIQGLAATAEALSLRAETEQALDDLVQLGLSVDQAWLLLAHWINTRISGLADAAMTALLQPLVAAIDPLLAAAATTVLDRHLGAYLVSLRST